MTLLSAALWCVRAVQIGGSVDSVALILLGANSCSTPAFAQVRKESGF